MIDPADPEQLEKLLRRHGITLQHRLGQNFLIDPALRDVIAEAAGTSGEDDLLEVGAGVNEEAGIVMTIRGSAKT